MQALNHTDINPGLVRSILHPDCQVSLLGLGFGPWTASPPSLSLHSGQSHSGVQKQMLHPRSGPLASASRQDTHTCRARPFRHPPGVREPAHPEGGWCAGHRVGAPGASRPLVVPGQGSEQQSTHQHTRTLWGPRGPPQAQDDKDGELGANTANTHSINRTLNWGHSGSAQQLPGPLYWRPHLPP